MFLSSHEIARSRTHALNNLLELSAAWFDAGERFSALFSDNRREATLTGGRHWSSLGDGQIHAALQTPATLLLENAARASRLLDGAMEIIGETHKAMIRSAESHVRVANEMVFATINRATKTCPWEAELPLKAMKASLQSAEQGLHDLSALAIESVTLAEQGIHETSDSLEVKKPLPRKRAASRQKAI